MINYFFSVFKKATSGKYGGGTYTFITSFVMFNMFLFGGIVGLLSSIFSSNFEFGVFIGILLSLIILVVHFAYPGYKYLDKVKKYSMIKANIFYYLSILLSFGLMIICVYAYVV